MLLVQSLVLVQITAMHSNQGSTTKADHSRSSDDTNLKQWSVAVPELFGTYIKFWNFLHNFLFSASRFASWT